MKTELANDLGKIFSTVVDGLGGTDDDRAFIRDGMVKLVGCHTDILADKIHSWLVRLGDPATPRSVIIAEMIETERKLRE